VSAQLTECAPWHTKAAYRFLDNDRVNESEILAGHFQATRDRAAATTGPILVLHDTTEFSYKREDIDAVGKTRAEIAGADRLGRLRRYTACGILTHSSLAVMTEGSPLGLTAIKFWSREKFHGANALKKHINPTRVPIEQKESIRWLDNLRQSTVLLGAADRCVHIGDRESDIYDHYCPTCLGAEQSKFRIAERLVNLLAMFCILSWRIFWLTMLNRSTRHATPSLVFTPLEIDLSKRPATDRSPNATARPSLSKCLTQLTRLGGHLNRASDAPPGNTVIWRGLSRLTDIEIGYLLGAQHAGS